MQDNKCHKYQFNVAQKTGSRKLMNIIAGTLLLLTGCNNGCEPGNGGMTTDLAQDLARDMATNPDPAAQPELKWALRCGSTRPSNDMGESIASNDIGTDAAFDHAGNVYITGSFSGSVTCTVMGTALPTGFSAISASGGSFVAKLDPQGIVQWVRPIGDTLSTRGTQLAFKAFDTKIAARPDGVVYVTGYAQLNPNVDGQDIKGERFVLSLSEAGRLRWLVPLRVPAGSQLKITSLHATQAGGQYTLRLGRLCRYVSLTSAGDCSEWSQYVWPILDSGGDRAIPLEVSLFPLGDRPDVNQGVFDLGDDEQGRLTWVGGNTVSVDKTGIPRGPVGPAAYLVRQQADGQWSGGFVLEDKQVAELTRYLAQDDVPWAPDSLRYGTRAYVDRDGNTYVGTLFNGNKPSPWIRKFGPNGSAELWGENVDVDTTATDYSLGFIGIRGDYHENPVFAAHAFGSTNKLVSSMYPLHGAAKRVGGGPPDYDILLWKLDRSRTVHGPHPIPLWATPTRIALGSKSLVGFDVHPPTNRIVVLSRTSAATIQVDGKGLPALTRPEGKKDSEYDLALFVFGPKAGP